MKTLTINSRHIKGNRYEVNGVIFYADSMSDAVSKWMRKKVKNDD